MGKNILAVDDSSGVRKMVKFALKTKGHDVVTAVDGREGLEKLMKGDYELIILDINMPRLDGFGLMDKLKKIPEKADIPILMLTTEGQDEDKDKALGMGANTYMVKPFKPTELISTVEKMLGNE